MRYTGAPRTLAEREALQAALGEHRLARRDQRLLQITVVIRLPRRMSDHLPSIA
jgi:hypothetical protein